MVAGKEAYCTTVDPNDQEQGPIMEMTLTVNDKCRVEGYKSYTRDIVRLDSDGKKDVINIITVGARRV